MPFTIYTRLIVSALEEMSNEKEQRRLWLGENSDGTEMSSFVEARECLFTDSGLGLELDKGRVVFDEPIDGLLIELDAMLARLEDLDDAEIIAHQLMVQVRKLSAKLLALFDPIITSGND